jgi:hypothetical protein
MITTRQRSGHRFGLTPTLPLENGFDVAAEVTGRILPSNPPVPESTMPWSLNRSKRSEQRLDSLSPLPPFAPVKCVSLASAATAFAPSPESNLPAANNG